MTERARIVTAEDLDGWIPEARDLGANPAAGTFLPKIAEFFGISIYMYFREHGPPHFHARYGGQEALFSIEDVSVLRGELSPRAQRLVVEWAIRHQQELLRNWQRARNHQPLEQIEPLDEKRGSP